MFSARAFVLLWAALTAAVLGYALLDLHLFNPTLEGERYFSMEPDLKEIHQMWHWGGRLVRERQWQLLVPNAVVLGGLGALALHGIARWFSKRRREEVPEARNSLAPTSGHSVPPPPL